MNAPHSADADRGSASWSLSTEELKRRIDQMYAGVSDPRTVDPDVTAA